MERHGALVVSMLGSVLGSSINVSNTTMPDITDIESSNDTAPTVPPDYKDGGLPLISDSLFSLIIMLYVLLAFFFVFFLFCWRRGPDRSLPNNKVTRMWKTKFTLYNFKLLSC